MAEPKPIITRPGTWPHVEWIELHADGVLHECAVMKKDRRGNIYFFELNALDSIDKRRLMMILADRNSRQFELWDLMSQKTLGNGVNALTYFNQLVKVVTPSGKILTPTLGVIGEQVGTKRIRPKKDEAAPAEAE